MALVSCPDCGRSVSDRAPTCPHCGAPIAHETILTANMQGKGEGIFMKSLNCGCMIVLGFIAFAVVMIIIAMAGSS